MPELWYLYIYTSNTCNNNIVNDNAAAAATTQTHANKHRKQYNKQSNHIRERVWQTSTYSNLKSKTDGQDLDWIKQQVFDQLYFHPVGKLQGAPTSTLGPLAWGLMSLQLTKVHHAKWLGKADWGATLCYRRRPTPPPNLSLERMH